MNYSNYLNLNLPSRDNTTDLADINVISENFETIDNEFENVYNKLENTGVINTVSGNPIVLRDSVNAPLKNLKLFGKTTQDGTPTPEAPIPLVSVGDSGSFTVKIQGENVEEQTLTMPYTLPNGNEVDFAKGVLTQRIWYGRVTSIIQGFLGAQKTHFTGELKYNAKATANNNELGYVLCNIAKNVSANVQYTTNTIPATISVTDAGGINLAIEGITTLEEFNTYLANNEVYIAYQLATPIETPLTESELNAYKKLHTNKPTTTILSEADMEVSYVADTKLYIDNKIAELTALTLEV